MRNTAYWFYAAIILSFTLSGCLEEESPRPELLASEVQTAVQGKWNIQRIESQLCRERNCTSENYEGRPADYFEFRADSAFLVRADSYGKPYSSAYKIAYLHAGTIVLSGGSWMGRFEVKEIKPAELVLVNSFTGLDPNAVFTDTYYLYR